MRKIAVGCVAGMLSIQVSAASVQTPIHFIYEKPGATPAQFQSDRDVCAHRATRTRYAPLGRARWIDVNRPSSTIFLNCMDDRGYTLSKTGWDTGVLWVLPYRPRY
ncbi:MAG: hypothetical protein WDM81_12825 [Rhizomicrobium sp.]